jgi:pimeloyl-ACP methyl ester carboxylesterase
MLKATSTSSNNKTIQLHDGRTLAYAEYGSPEGRTLFYFHGHPGSRLEAGLLADHLRLAGIRLIGIDRPGMGLSTFQSHRRIFDWPNDVVELAANLHIDRFSVVGFSGGGPYALACAYKLPQHLIACGIVAGVGRIGRFLSFLSQWLPWLISPITARFLRDEARAKKLLGLASRSWVEPDRKSLLLPGIKQTMAASLVEAHRQGAKGPAYDGMLFGKSWGFKLEEVTFAPIFQWHGELDKDVPISEAQVAARRLRHCKATYYPVEGHISLIANHAEEIVKVLI